MRVEARLHHQVQRADPTAAHAIRGRLGGTTRETERHNMPGVAAAGTWGKTAATERVTKTPSDHLLAAKTVTISGPFAGEPSPFAGEASYHRNHDN
jgi:hypothetical protein